MNLNPSELPNLLGNAALACVLFWFARRFLDQWQAAQRELFEALQGIVRENNQLLISVRDVLHKCHHTGETEFLAGHTLPAKRHEKPHYH